MAQLCRGPAGPARPGAREVQPARPWEASLRTPSRTVTDVELDVVPCLGPKSHGHTWSSGGGGRPGHSFLRAKKNHFGVYF